MGIFVSHRKRGFTLVEIVVAVGIVAILATAVIGTLQEGRKKARDAERVSDLKQVQLALRLYKDAESSYPLGHDGGTVLGEGGAFDATLAEYVTATVSDSMGSVSDSTYEYVYDSDYDCSVAGASKKILYAKTMERSGSGNWATICGGTPPGTNSYVIIIQ